MTTVLILPTPAASLSRWTRLALAAMLCVSAAQAQQAVTGDAVQTRGPIPVAQRAAEWRQPHQTLYFRDVQNHIAISDDRVALKDSHKCCVQHDDQDNFDLAFVEFDAQGDFWDREQLGIARTQLRQRMRGSKPLLVEYVHGWHNNSQEDDDRDVAHFRTFLRVLARSAYIKAKGYRVYGVYLSWPGERYREAPKNLLTKPPLLLPHLLSFFSKKATGARVGTMPMMSEALFWMVHEARAIAPRDAYTVLMGHSFGAMVLENALAQAVASSVAMIPAGAGSEPPPPADLVLLVNAASDSLRAKGLAEMFDRMGRSAAPRYRDANRPLIVNVTSEGDGATGMAFPLATNLSNALSGNRRYEVMGKSRGIPGVDPYEYEFKTGLPQREFLTHTPGHNRYLITHDVTADKDTDANLGVGDVLSSTGETAPLAKPEQYVWFQKAFDANLASPPKRIDADGKPAWRFRSVGRGGGDAWSEIRRVEGSGLATPYWIVRTPSSIIRRHEDVFSPQALCLYATLFRIENPNPNKARPAKTR